MSNACTRLFQAGELDDILPSPIYDFLVSDKFRTRGAGCRGFLAGGYSMRRALMCLILSLTLQSSLVKAAEKPEHRALAEYYAPVVYQESKSAVLDYIT